MNELETYHKLVRDLNLLIARLNGVRSDLIADFMGVAGLFPDMEHDRSGYTASNMHAARIYYSSGPASDAILTAQSNLRDLIGLAQDRIEYLEAQEPTK